MHRIVITGSGIISAIGIGKQECLEALLNNRSGISSPRYLPTTHTEFPVGEVRLSNSELCEMAGLKVENDWSRTALLGMAAVHETLQDACLEQATGIAFVSGTTVGGMDLTENGYPDKLTSKGLRQHDCGGCTNTIANHFGCFSFTTTSSTACSSALNAIILGKWLIESGQYDIVVAGGCESLSRFHLNGFKSLMILDEQPCKPFDANRRGLNLGEGAAYVVLESEAHALQRGANIHAVLKGVGNSCDAFHPTASSEHGDGAYTAMTQALKDAHLNAEDIQYVNAHGTATPNNDATESAALRRVYATLPLISSTKGLTGHTTSASGSIETVICLLALEHSFVPANAGFSCPDAECIVPIDHVEHKKLINIMCNSFGFGGNDSSIILGKYE